jgi:GT2 family glycosyltransferase
VHSKSFCGNLGIKTVQSCDLSIVIVTRNTVGLLRRALASVLAASGQLSVEVVVVDNGSTDGTAAMMTEEFPEVRYLPQNTNLGFARANNIGATAAQGTYLCLMNSDARLQPDTLTRAVEYMRGNPPCGILGAQLLNTDGSRQNSIANFPSLTTELFNKSALRLLFPKKYPGKNHAFTEPLVVESIVGAFLFTPRALWQELGGLDERYFFFLEETDYCLRVQRTGRTVVHHPHLRVWHDQGQTAKQVLIPARIEYWKSRYLYFQKHHPTWVIQFLSGGLLTKLSLGWLFNALTRPSKARVQLAILQWHLNGRPASSGLNPR